MATQQIYGVVVELADPDNGDDYGKLQQDIMDHMSDKYDVHAVEVMSRREQTIRKTVVSDGTSTPAQPTQ